MELVLLQGAGDWTQFLFLGGIFVVAYFFFLRPQQQKQKETKRKQDELKTGDQVITAGGFYGKVITTEGAKVVLEIAKGTNVRVEKTSITSVNPEEEEKKKS